jgi:raffinose/stachyose/melibiose transport system substrate-binding protein
MNKRGFGILVAAVSICAMILSGCSSASPVATSAAPAVTAASTETPAATPAPAEKVTLNVMSQRVEDKAYYDALIAAFQTKYPNITVKLDLVPTAQYQTVVTTRIASDSVDVLVSPSQLSDPDTRTTLFLNLEGQPFLQNVYKENLADEFMIGVDAEGAVYDVPIIGTTFVTFYNKQMFADQGIAVPTTFAEWTAACDKLKAAGITPFLFGGKDQWPINCIFDAFGPPLVQAAKPDFFKTLNTGATKFTDPEFLSVITRLNTMYQSYFDKNSLGIAYADAPGLFAQGKCAMYIDGNWSGAQINQAKPAFDVGVFLTPASDDATANQTATVRNGMAWSVIHSSPHKDAALLWMDFLFQPDNQTAACNIAASLPVGPNVTVADPLTNACAGLIQNSSLKVSCFEAQIGKYTPGSTFNYTPYLIQMLSGQTTPEQVVQSLQKDFDDSKANWKIPAAQ